MPMSCNTKEYQREYQKKYRRENKERLDAYYQDWCDQNKDKTAALSRSYYQANKKKIRAYKWKLRYGITEEEVNSFYTSQNGCCAICQKQLNDVFVIDHCHSTGNVRGLLCNQCNQAIGLLKENTQSLLNAIDYINKGK